MPGIGELIDGAMQQAPQPARQAMCSAMDIGRWFRRSAPLSSNPVG
jgi:hypothetical protein